MNITFACPHCEQDARRDVPHDAESFACPKCDHAFQVPEDAVVDGQLTRCLVCPSVDLFVRKDFPQQVGVGIVTLGFALSCVTWYYQEVVWTFAVLFATALIDLVLYWLVGDSLCCYRCHAEYRLIGGHERHGRFDLETHERHRQQKIRLAEATHTSTRSAAAKPL